MFQQNQICHEKKIRKSGQAKSSSSGKPHIPSMSLLAKLEELKENNDYKRRQSLLDSAIQDIARIKDPETLLSHRNTFAAFKFCYQHQGLLPCDCWHCCEAKILEFISDERFSGFLSSKDKRGKILLYFPSPAISNTIKSSMVFSMINH